MPDEIPLRGSLPYAERYRLIQHNSGLNAKKENAYKKLSDVTDIITLKQFLFKSDFCDRSLKRLKDVCDAFKLLTEINEMHQTNYNQACFLLGCLHFNSPTSNYKDALFFFDKLLSVSDKDLFLEIDNGYFSDTNRKITSLSLVKWMHAICELELSSNCVSLTSFNNIPIKTLLDNDAQVHPFLEFSDVLSSPKFNLSNYIYFRFYRKLSIWARNHGHYKGVLSCYRQLSRLGTVSFNQLKGLNELTSDSKSKIITKNKSVNITEKDIVGFYTNVIQALANDSFFNEAVEIYRETIKPSLGEWENKEAAHYMIRLMAEKSLNYYKKGVLWKDNSVEDIIQDGFITTFNSPKIWNISDNRFLKKFDRRLYAILSSPENENPLLYKKAIFLFICYFKCDHKTGIQIDQHVENLNKKQYFIESQNIISDYLSEHWVNLSDFQRASFKLLEDASPRSLFDGTNSPDGLDWGILHGMIRVYDYLLNHNNLIPWLKLRTERSFEIFKEAFNTIIFENRDLTMACVNAPTFTASCGEFMQTWLICEEKAAEVLHHLEGSSLFNQFLGTEISDLIHKKDPKWTMIYGVFEYYLTFLPDELESVFNHFWQHLCVSKNGPLFQPSPPLALQKLYSRLLETSTHRLPQRDWGTLSFYRYMVPKPIRYGLAAGRLLSNPANRRFNPFTKQKPRYWVSLLQNRYENLPQHVLVPMIKSGLLKDILIKSQELTSTSIKTRILNIFLDSAENLTLSQLSKYAVIIFPFITYVQDSAIRETLLLKGNDFLGDAFEACILETLDKADQARNLPVWVSELSGHFWDRFERVHHSLISQAKVQSSSRVRHLLVKVPYLLHEGEHIETILDSWPDSLIEKTEALTVLANKRKDRLLSLMRLADISLSVLMVFSEAYPKQNMIFDFCDLFSRFKDVNKATAHDYIRHEIELMELRSLEHSYLIEKKVEALEKIFKTFRSIPFFQNLILDVRYWLLVKGLSPEKISAPDKWNTIIKNDIETNSRLFSGIRYIIDNYSSIGVTTINYNDIYHYIDSKNDRSLNVIKTELQTLQSTYQLERIRAFVCREVCKSHSSTEAILEYLNEIKHEIPFLIGEMASEPNRNFRSIIAVLCTIFRWFPEETSPYLVKLEVSEMEEDFRYFFHAPEGEALLKDLRLLNTNLLLQHPMLRLFILKDSCDIHGLKAHPCLTEEQSSAVKKLLAELNKFKDEYRHFSGTLTFNGCEERLLDWLLEEGLTEECLTAKSKWTSVILKALEINNSENMLKIRRVLSRLKSPIDFNLIYRKIAATKGQLAPGDSYYAWLTDCDSEIKKHQHDHQLPLIKKEINDMLMQQTVLSSTHFEEIFDKFEAIPHQLGELIDYIYNFKDKITPKVLPVLLFLSTKYPSKEVILEKLSFFQKQENGSLYDDVFKDYEFLLEGLVISFNSSSSFRNQVITMLPYVFYHISYYQKQHLSIITPTPTTEIKKEQIEFLKFFYTTYNQLPELGKKLLTDSFSQAETWLFFEDLSGVEMNDKWTHVILKALEKGAESQYKIDAILSKNNSDICLNFVEIYSKIKTLQNELPAGGDFSWFIAQYDKVNAYHIKHEFNPAFNKHVMPLIAAENSALISQTQLDVIVSEIAKIPNSKACFISEISGRKNISAINVIQLLLHLFVLGAQSEQSTFQTFNNNSEWKALETFQKPEYFDSFKKLYSDTELFSGGLYVSFSSENSLMEKLVNTLPFLAAYLLKVQQLALNLVLPEPEQQLTPDEIKHCKFIKFGMEKFPEFCRPILNDELEIANSLLLFEGIEGRYLSDSNKWTHALIHIISDQEKPAWKIDLLLSLERTPSLRIDYQKAYSSLSLALDADWKTYVQNALEAHEDAILYPRIALSIKTLISEGASERENFYSDISYNLNLIERKQPELIAVISSYLSKAKQNSVSALSFIFFEKIQGAESSYCFLESMTYIDELIHFYLSPTGMRYHENLKAHIISQLRDSLSNEKCLFYATLLKRVVKPVNIISFMASYLSLHHIQNLILNFPDDLLYAPDVTHPLLQCLKKLTSLSINDLDEFTRIDTIFCEILSAIIKNRNDQQIDEYDPLNEAINALGETLNSIDRHRDIYPTLCSWKDKIEQVTYAEGFSFPKDLFTGSFELTTDMMSAMIGDPILRPKRSTSEVSPITLSSLMNRFCNFVTETKEVAQFNLDPDVLKTFRMSLFMYNNNLHVCQELKEKALFYGLRDYCKDKLRGLERGVISEDHNKLYKHFFDDEHNFKRFGVQKFGLIDIRRKKFFSHPFFSYYSYQDFRTFVKTYNIDPSIHSFQGTILADYFYKSQEFSHVLHYVYGRAVDSLSPDGDSSFQESITLDWLYGATDSDSANGAISSYDISPLSMQSSGIPQTIVYPADNDSLEALESDRQPQDLKFASRGFEYQAQSKFTKTASDVSEKILTDSESQESDNNNISEFEISAQPKTKSNTYEVENHQVPDSKSEWAILPFGGWLGKNQGKNRVHQTSALLLHKAFSDEGHLIYTLVVINSGEGSEYHPGSRISSTDEHGHLNFFKDKQSPFMIYSFTQDKLEELQQILTMAGQLYLSNYSDSSPYTASDFYGTIWPHHENQLSNKDPFYFSQEDINILARTTERSSSAPFQVLKNILYLHFLAPKEFYRKSPLSLIDRHGNYKKFMSLYFLWLGNNYSEVAKNFPLSLSYEMRRKLASRTVKINESNLDIPANIKHFLIAQADKVGQALTQEIDEIQKSKGQRLDLGPVFPQKIEKPILSRVSSQVTLKSSIVPVLSLDYTQPVDNLITKLISIPKSGSKDRHFSIYANSAVENVALNKFYEIDSWIDQITNDNDIITLSDKIDKVCHVYYFHWINQLMQQGFDTLKKRYCDNPLDYSRQVLTAYCLLYFTDRCIRKHSVLSGVLDEMGAAIDTGCSQHSNGNMIYNPANLTQVFESLMISRPDWINVLNRINNYFNIKKPSRPKALITIPFGSYYIIDSNDHIVYFSEEHNLESEIVSLKEKVISFFPSQKRVLEGRLGDASVQWKRNAYLMDLKMPLITPWLNASSLAIILSQSSFDFSTLSLKYAPSLTPEMSTVNRQEEGLSFHFRLKALYFREYQYRSFSRLVNDDSIKSAFAVQFERENDQLNKLVASDNISKLYHLGFLSATDSQLFKRLLAHLKDSIIDLNNKDHFYYFLDLMLKQRHFKAPLFQLFDDTNNKLLLEGFMRHFSKVLLANQDNSMAYVLVHNTICLMSLFKQIFSEAIEWDELILKGRKWLLDTAQSDKMLGSNNSLIVLQNLLSSYRFQSCINLSADIELFLTTLTLIQKFQNFGHPSMDVQQHLTEGTTTIEQFELIQNKILHQLTPDIQSYFIKHPSSITDILKVVVNKRLDSSELAVSADLMDPSTTWKIDKETQYWNKNDILFSPWDGSIYYKNYAIGSLPKDYYDHPLYKSYFGEDRFEVLYLDEVVILDDIEQQIGFYNSLQYPSKDNPISFKLRVIHSQLARNSLRPKKEVIKYNNTDFYFINTNFTSSTEPNSVYALRGHEITELLEFINILFSDEKEASFNIYRAASADVSQEAQFILKHTDQSKDVILHATVGKLGGITVVTAAQLCSWANDILRIPVYSKNGTPIFGHPSLIQNADSNIYFRSLVEPAETMLEIVKDNKFSALPKWYISSQIPGYFSYTLDQEHHYFWMDLSRSQRLHVCKKRDSDPLYVIDHHKGIILHQADLSLPLDPDKPYVTLCNLDHRQRDPHLKHLTDFEDPNFIVFEKTYNPMSELPPLEVVRFHRHKLNFNCRDNVLYSNELQGYVLAQNQTTFTFSRLKAYLKLVKESDNYLKSSDIHYILLVPNARLCIPNTDKHLESLNSPISYSTYISQLGKHSYSVISYNPSLKEFEVKTQLERIHLAYLLFSTATSEVSPETELNGYESAMNLLENCYQNSPYSGAERKLLETILESKDCHRNALAVRLRTHCLLARSLDLASMYKIAPYLVNIEQLLNLYHGHRHIDERCKLKTHEIKRLSALVLEFKRLHDIDLVTEHGRKLVTQLDRDLFVAFNNLPIKPTELFFYLEPSSINLTLSFWSLCEIDSSLKGSFFSLYNLIQSKQHSKEKIQRVLYFLANKILKDKDAKKETLYLLKILFYANTELSVPELPFVPRNEEYNWIKTSLIRAEFFGVLCAKTSSELTLKKIEEKPWFKKLAEATELSDDIFKEICEAEAVHPKDKKSLKNSFYMSFEHYQKCKILRNWLFSRLADSNNPFSEPSPVKPIAKVDIVLKDFKKKVQEKTAIPADKTQISLEKTLAEAVEKLKLRYSNSSLSFDVNLDLNAAQSQTASDELQEILHRLHPKKRFITITKSTPNTDEFPFDGWPHGDSMLAHKFIEGLKKSWNIYLTQPTYNYALREGLDIEQLEYALKYYVSSLGETSKAMSAWIKETANLIPANLNGWSLKVARMIGLETLTLRDVTRLLHNHKLLDQSNPFLTDIKSQLMEALVTFSVIETAIQQANRALSILGEYKLNNDPEKKQLLTHKLCLECAESRSYLINHEVNTLSDDDNSSTLENYDRQALLFEMENNLIIRPKQYALYKLLMNNDRLLTQLNMGEGKSSVILLMLIIEYSTKHELTRMIIPEELISEMKQLIESRVRPAFSMSVYLFPFHRRLYSKDPQKNKLTVELLQEIHDQLDSCKDSNNIVLMTPEQRFSLRLLLEEHLYDCFNLNKGTEMEIQLESKIKAIDEQLRQQLFEKDRYELELEKCACNSALEKLQNERKSPERRQELVKRMKLLIAIEYKVDRDVLDESDTIFDPLKELNFTIGKKYPMDGLNYRFTIPLILIRFLLKAENRNLLSPFFSFNQNRIQLKNESLYNSDLRRLLANYLIKDYWSTFFTAFSVHPDNDRLKARLISFLNESKSLKTFIEENPVFASLSEDQLTILRTIRCWVNCDSPVFRYVFSTRYLVDYGTIDGHLEENPEFKAYFRRTAFPFKGKDLPVIYSNFSHPDVLISFSILSYYYKGLSQNEIKTCFSSIIGNRYSSGRIYEEWLQELSISEQREIELSSLANVHDINLEDPDQLKEIEKFFATNPAIISYYIEHVVFSDLLEYREKLNADGLTISSTEKWIGTSGTVDMRYIFYNDSESDELSDIKTEISLDRLNDAVCKNSNPEVTISEEIYGEYNATDGKLLMQLSNNKNCRVKEDFDYTDTSSMLKEISKRTLDSCRENVPKIHALLDRGALITGKSNEAVAIDLIKLLGPSGFFEGVVYFDDMTSEKRVALFQKNMSPQCMLLSNKVLKNDSLFYYYNDVKTRGTDLKLPLKCRGILTVSPDQRRDDFCQAIMRLRQFGIGQTLEFWVPNQTLDKIRTKLNLPKTHNIQPKELYFWTVLNSIANLEEIKLFQQGKLNKVKNKKATLDSIKAIVDATSDFSEEQQKTIDIQKLIASSSLSLTNAYDNIFQRSSSERHTESENSQTHTNQKAQSQAQEKIQAIEKKEVQSGLDKPATESKIDFSWILSGLFPYSEQYKSLDDVMDLPTGVAGLPNSPLPRLLFTSNFLETKEITKDHHFRPVESFLEIKVHDVIPNTLTKTNERTILLAVSGQDADKITDVLNSPAAKIRENHCVLHQFNDPNGYSRLQTGCFQRQTNARFDPDTALLYTLLALYNGESGILTRITGSVYADNEKNSVELFRSCVSTILKSLSIHQKKKFKEYFHEIRLRRQRSKDYVDSPAEAVLS